MNQAIAAVLFAALALGVIVMAGAPGLARQERAYQAERV